MRNTTSSSTSQVARGSRDVRRHLAVLLMAAGSMGVVAAPSPSAADDVDLRRGDAAPPFAMKAIDGSTCDLETARGRAVVLSFGESSQDRTDRAWREISSMLATATFKDLPITWIVVLSKGSIADSSWLERLDGVRPVVIADERRDLFESYGVIAIPTVVVIDREGRIAHVIRGLSSTFGDTLQDAIHLGLGRLSGAEFDLRLHPAGAREPTEAERRAARLRHLAEHLVSREMLEMAELKYRESIEAAPHLCAARIGLADMLLDQDRLADAEAVFRGALAVDPESIDAAAGLAEVLIRSDDGAVAAEAERLIEGLIERGPTVPRVHFVRGLLHERRGEFQEAAMSFKTAAMLLLVKQRALERVSSADESG